jgi:adenine-specific DNA-methyltransferase
MAGTNSIGYALKKRNRIISNDIQYYSYVVGKALLHNYKIPSDDELRELIEKKYNHNKKFKVFTFFEKNYTDTYFSEHQCVDIDSIRYSLEELDSPLKDYVLTLLMSVMCKVQSSPGHFAQYMPKDHKRIIPLREMKVYELLYSKNRDFSNFIRSKFNNSVHNLDYNILLKDKIIDDIECFYLDSPYTSDQYSRFYHVLETVSKYDNPKLEHKAKYRNQRSKSKFCSKTTVRDEFENIIKFVANKNKKLLISYSNKGVLPIDELIELANIYFKEVEVKYFEYKHSSQGNGNIKIKELLLILK